ncbi:MAG: ferredoxin reductase [Propionibacteriales bacterium]|nr:ferredoxin reductase [Propionibacteriales bacterium]
MTFLRVGPTPDDRLPWGRQLRRVAEMLATPLVPDDYLDLLDPLSAGGTLRGRVLAVHPEAADSATLVIRPGRDWRGHRPGQYVRVGVDVDGVRHSRAYSLTSRTDDALIAITVKAMPDGVVSNQLVHHTRPGTHLVLDQAAGEFTWSVSRPGRVLFLTGGSGITPAMGMIRNHLDEFTDAVLVHSAPSAEEVVFGDELRALHDDGRVRLVERHTATEGLLALDQLDRLVPDWRDRTSYVCGPVGLMDAAQQHWDAAGLADRLHSERFRPRIMINEGDGGTAEFTRSGVRAVTTGETAVLDAGEQAGVLMRSGCRMGICFGCVTPLQSGSVRDLRNGDLTTAADGDPVNIQTCVSTPVGPCQIDA